MLWLLNVLLEALVVTGLVRVTLVELCETVTEADCVVVPLEVPVVVALTGPTDEIELGTRVLVSLVAEAVEDERLEVDTTLVVRGAVGPEDAEVLLELPYGAPLEVMLELIPLEGPVVRGAVGPAAGALLVLFP